LRWSLALPGPAKVIAEFASWTRVQGIFGVTGFHQRQQPSLAGPSVLVGLAKRAAVPALVLLP
jgi:hypothetical protein